MAAEIVLFRAVSFILPSCDKAAYEGSFDAFAALGVALPSMLYQVYTGTDADKTKVTVHIQDQASGEVFNTVVYPDAMKNG
ncbi:hypothetical protein ACLBWT_17240 [Paenibacillus sp. D51F]